MFSIEFYLIFILYCIYFLLSMIYNCIIQIYPEVVKMTAKQILFTDFNTAKLVDSEIGNLKDNDVKVMIEFSSISCGTEKALVSGNQNISVVSKEGCEIKFPRATGYSSSGVVLEVGKNVTSVKKGDRVALMWSEHKKINVIDERKIVKLHDNVSMKEAALFNIATFPLAAIRKTRLEVGESLLVMGLGILGLFAVHLAKASGAAPVIAVDPIKERREKALKFGADIALNPMDEDFSKKVKEITNGGVNCAIEVTGIGAGLNGALDCMAKYGRVALLGCTRDKNFTVDYYRKVHGPGIELIGAHAMARPNFESSPGRFTQLDDFKAMEKLSAFGRINLESMIDETFSPNDCTDVYLRLVEGKDFPVVSQFDWREIK